MYKVVKRESDGLYSVYGVNKYKLKYEPNVKTLPVVGSKIFCFRLLTDAKNFCMSSGQCETWECEVENPIGMSTVAKIALSEIVTLDRINKFWLGGATVIEDIYTGSPRGTLICDSLTLTKRV